MTKANNQSPGLFGIKNSNKDFSDDSAWGKNQFNNTFPAALLNYMHSRGLDPVYLRLDPEDLGVRYGKISVPDLYGVDPSSKEIYFAFEDIFQPYRSIVVGNPPRVDLVIKKIKEEGDFDDISPLEIKLTALPDDQTCEFAEEDYGSEIVVRPDTIVYLAYSFVHFADGNKEEIKKYLEPIFSKKIEWASHEEVDKITPQITQIFDKLMIKNPSWEIPLMVQPVWKTKGKSTALADHCLDVFVWSNFAMTRLFFNQVNRNNTVTRPERAVVWLAMMLYDFATQGKIDHKRVIDTYTYDAKNDKAFSVGGATTRGYMRSPELTQPRISKTEIPEIILGSGEQMLSPERRFDAIVQNTVDLFKS